MVRGFIDSNGVLAVVGHKHDGVPIFVVPRFVYLVYNNSCVTVRLVAGDGHCTYQGEEKYFYPFHLSTSFRVVVGGLRCSAS